MLVEFSVANFRSLKAQQTFSLLPAGKIRERIVKPFPSQHYKHLQVLPTAVLYGPNNSGKSNFLQACEALQWLVMKSGHFNSDQKLEVNEYFAFNIESHQQPTELEVDFIASNQRRYVYALVFDQKRIIKEELHFYNISPTGKTTVKKLFQRNEQTISFSSDLKGSKSGVSFGENQLFLSRADIGGNEELQVVYRFFSSDLFILQFTETEYTDFLTRRYAKFIAENKNSRLVTLVEQILAEMDSNIVGIDTLSFDVNKMAFPEGITQEVKDKVFEELKHEIQTKHKLFDNGQQVGEVKQSLHNQSTGTRKILGLLPIVLSALQNGETLFVDELNTSLHTEVTALMINWFNDPAINPRGAQLILTTHDITLLDKQLFDTDPIFVLEKDQFAESNLYTFADFSGLRQGTRLSDYYNHGRLGGIPDIATNPYVKDLIRSFVNQEHEEQEQEQEENEK